MGDPMTGRQKQVLLACHAHGKLNRELAQLLGVSEATVKRWKGQLHLGDNCPRNALGQRGEDLFIQAALRAGFPAVGVGTGRNSHDVQIGPLRIEVKTAVQTPTGWRYRLSTVRPSFHAESKPTVKNYTQDCELLALVALDRHHQLVFIQLRYPGKTSYSLRPDFNEGLDHCNWAVLRRLLSPAAA